MKKLSVKHKISENIRSNFVGNYTNKADEKKNVYL